jgi:D-threo-aldose 1-dehydrogenase
MQLRPLGQTTLKVTPICVGTSALGNFPAQYGYEVDASQAAATLRAVFRGPFNFIDTSNEYGNGGDSERRIGAAIKEIGGLPAHFVLATKVDPIPGSRDFSGPRVRKSVEESLQRLGLERLQLVYFHDPEKISFDEAVAKGGAVEALVDLKERGIVEHIGVAGGPIDLMLRYVATGAFEVVISHNRFTLVDRSAEPLLVESHRRGIAFVNAAPFGGGMLVKGPDKHPNYCYAPASAALLTQAREIERLCRVHEISLAAAALQFSMREKRIASTIVGLSAPERIAQTTALADLKIPDEFWRALDDLASGRTGPPQ